MIVLEQVSNKLQKEEQVIHDFRTSEERVNKLEVASIPLKWLERGIFNILPGEVIMLSGSIDFVKAGLRQLGKTLPPPDCYPESMKQYLHRSVSYGTKRDLTLDMLPKFIKPADDYKLFTGFVCDDPDDYRLQHVGNKRRLAICDVVKWKSEWRYYCFDHTFYESAFYNGDQTVQPDEDVVKEILKAFAKERKWPAVVDIGVLDDGTTALVEINEAFSIGYYEGITPQLYQMIICKRWRHLSGFDEVIEQQEKENK